MRPTSISNRWRSYSPRSCGVLIRRLASGSPLVVLVALCTAGCSAPPEPGTPVGNVTVMPQPTATLPIITGLNSSGDRTATQSPHIVGTGANEVPGSVGAQSIPGTPGAPTAAAASAALRPTDEPLAPAGTPTSSAAGVPTSGGELIGLSAEVGTVGGTYHLASIRVGEHPDEGFTRIVWEMVQGAAGQPRVSAVERSNAAEPLTGASMAGSARIELTFVDTNAMGSATTANTPDSPVVRGVSVLPTAAMDDSRLVFGVALERPAQYKLGVLADPVRVVLDVYQ